ncbi:MAG: 2OG-Fe dioxygenase family protein [Gammaproteobacteria bacterium]
MLNQKIAAPITLFDVLDFGVPYLDFLHATKPVYEYLEWDLYDVRRKQIQSFQKKYPKIIVPSALYADYFKGILSLEQFRINIENSSSQSLNFDFFHDIKPFRKRSISQFELYKARKKTAFWSLRRISTGEFAQNDACIEKKSEQDYRVLPRKFLDTPEFITENDCFVKILCGVANLLSTHVNAEKMQIAVHHTFVQATPDSLGDNSPEGIHQDGYDYIVSALIVERENIIGARSQIYGNDKYSQLFSTVLKPGQGLLQPDRGTELWHNVSPFSTVKSKIGYRTSIGFDINIL